MPTGEHPIQVNDIERFLIEFSIVGPDEAGKTARAIVLDPAYMLLVVGELGIDLMTIPEAMRHVNEGFPLELHSSLTEDV